MERLIEEKHEKGYSYKMYWNYAFKEYHVVFFHLGHEIKYQDIFGEKRGETTKLANLIMLKWIIRDMEKAG